MKYEVKIEKGGYYPEIKISGDGSDLYKDGLVIDSPGEVVRINRLIVDTVRSPIIVKRAYRVIIDNALFTNFHGDAFHLRQSNVHVRDYKGRDIKTKLPYEEWHTDVILQAFAVKEDGNTLDPEGVITNIIFDNIDVECHEKEVNGVMLSELCRYKNFQIGTSSLKLDLAIPFWLNGNNLSHSVIGGHIVDIKENEGTIPKILLKDRPKQGVCSNHGSHNNTYFNIPGIDQSQCGESNYIFNTAILSDTDIN